MSKILGICGSLRAKSFNLAALKVAAEVMPAGMTLEITSIADLPLFNGDVLDAGAPAAAVKFRQFRGQRLDGLDLGLRAQRFNFHGAPGLNHALIGGRLRQRELQLKYLLLPFQGRYDNEH